MGPSRNLAGGQAPNQLCIYTRETRQASQQTTRPLLIKTLPNPAQKGTSSVGRAAQRPSLPHTAVGDLAHLTPRRETEGLLEPAASQAVCWPCCQTAHRKPKQHHERRHAGACISKKELQLPIHRWCASHRKLVRIHKQRYWH